MARNKLTTLVTSYAPEAFKHLNGLFCIYKPEGLHFTFVKHMLLLNLARDLNEMVCREPRTLVKIDEDPYDRDALTVTTVPDFADNPLVVGPRYLKEDMKLLFADALHKNASGVSVVGINYGRKLLHNLDNSYHIKAYHLGGQLGLATDDFTNNGRPKERSTFRHVSQEKLDRVISAIQSSHQKAMFSSSDIDLQTQEAYDLAVKGLIRPKDQRVTLIYGIKCLKFDPPNFALEVQCINESYHYLAHLIHEIGLQLKSTAHCTQVRRVRHGNFHLADALLRKHWNIQDIIQNIYHLRSRAKLFVQMPDEESHLKLKVPVLQEKHSNS